MANEASKAKQKRTLFITNLDLSIDEQALYTIFSTFGDVIDVSIPLDKQFPLQQNYQQQQQQQQQSQITQETSQPGRHRGFGFVEFALIEDAQSAISNMNMNTLMGKVIKCSVAKKLAANVIMGDGRSAIWASEEYQKQYGGSADANDAADDA